MTIGSFMPTDSIWTERLMALAALFPEHEIIIEPDKARAALPRLDAILALRLESEAYEAAAALKAVFVPFTGLNHLPVDLLVARGVRAFNVHGNAESVAQSAIAMTLAFYGRTVEFHNDLRMKKWHGFWVGKGVEDQWSSIYRRPCAVFGVGAIGRAIARILKAFDCPVTGYRRRSRLPLPPCFDRVEEDLGSAVEGAELHFIALPLTGATKGLFTKELLLSMRGKFLVNVGRGSIVDEEGLYLALSSGVLKGAAIDTWYEYPPAGATEGAPSRFPIHELPNVLLSPHVGGSSREAAGLNMEDTLRNIASWLRGERCANEADLRELY
jgi:phosphoglycerate dehydrogenase-like enzyme